jgi:hypothetical protein
MGCHSVAVVITQVHKYEIKITKIQTAYALINKTSKFYLKTLNVNWEVSSLSLKLIFVLTRETKSIHKL